MGHLEVETLPVRMGQVWKRQIEIRSPLPWELLVVTCWTMKGPECYSYCKL